VVVEEVTEEVVAVEMSMVTAEEVVMAEVVVVVEDTVVVELEETA